MNVFQQMHFMRENTNIYEQDRNKKKQTAEETLALWEEEDKEDARMRAEIQKENLKREEDK